MKNFVDKNFESSIEKFLNVIQKKDITSQEASLVLPLIGSEKIHEIESKLAVVHQKISHLIVIGIGWSSLGAKAIMKFLGRKRKWYAELHFFETIDGDATYGRLHSIISSVASIADLAICEISKSGGTLETKLLSEYISHTLEKNFWSRPLRMVITWKGSQLEKSALAQNDIVFHLEEMVWGRFSVFSHVGLVPLYLWGYNIELLLQGAQSVIDEFVRDPYTHAVSRETLWIIDGLSHGRNWYLNFFFDTSSVHIGRWFVQLFAESFGKEANPTYLFPVSATGTMDLHSIAQSVYAQWHPWLIEWIRCIPQEDNDVFREARDALYHGALQAAIDQGIPCRKTFIRRSEYDIAEWMQQKMLVIMLLSAICEVDAFDQPLVELYKSRAREYLAEKNTISDE